MDPEVELLGLCSAIHVATELLVAATFHFSARDKPQPRGGTKPPVYFHLLLSPGYGMLWDASCASEKSTDLRSPFSCAKRWPEFYLSPGLWLQLTYHVCCYFSPMYSWHQGFPDSSVGKESICNAGDLIWILAWEDPLEKWQAIHSKILGLPLLLSW